MQSWSIQTSTAKNATARLEPGKPGSSSAPWFARPRAQVAERLSDENICVWDSNDYALAVTEQLGAEAGGGMVRVGVAHSNSSEELLSCRRRWNTSRRDETISRIVDEIYNIG